MVNRKLGGFTLVEAVVACFLLTLLGLAIGQMFLTVTKSLGYNRNQQKASALGEMVLEQYEALATRDPSRLPEFTRENATPAEFFKTRDDLGYDGMRISTLTRPGTKTGGSEVVVKISWGMGASIGSMTMTKFSMEGDRPRSDNPNLSGL